MTDNGAKELTVTPGTHWRKPREEGYRVQLPSTNVVTLRPVALNVMLLSGDIPDMLTPLVTRMLYEEVENEDLAATVETSRGMLEFIDLVVRAAVLEPAIVDVPTGDGEIALADVEFEDRLFVFNLAIQPTRVIEKFRDEQGRALAAVPDGENDLQPAE